MPAVRVNERIVLVVLDSAGGARQDAFGLYARVSSHDQRSDLDRQVGRLSEWAPKAGHPVVRLEQEAWLRHGGRTVGEASPSPGAVGAGIDSTTSRFSGGPGLSSREPRE